MKRAISAALAVLALGATGCLKPKSKLPTETKRAPYPFPEYAKPDSAASASLFASNRPGLFEDARARQVGDILVIFIDEEESAVRGATSDLERSSQANMGVSEMMGLLPVLQARYPNLDPTKILGYSADASFQGKGQKTRTGSLIATLPVQVRKVLPNGDLYVEGGKRVSVDKEAHNLFLRGIVRAADVRADDSVPSSRIAGAEIEYTGSGGDINDQQRPGWISRGLAKIWPF